MDRAESQFALSNSAEEPAQKATPAERGLIVKISNIPWKLDRRTRQNLESGLKGLLLVLSLIKMVLDIVVILGL